MASCPSRTPSSTPLSNRQQRRLSSSAISPPFSTFPKPNFTERSQSLNISSALWKAPLRFLISSRHPVVPTIPRLKTTSIISLLDSGLFVSPITRQDANLATAKLPFMPTKSSPLMASIHRLTSASISLPRSSQTRLSPPPNISPLQSPFLRTISHTHFILIPTSSKYVASSPSSTAVALLAKSGFIILLIVEFDTKTDIPERQDRASQSQPML
mmetsp:Transcript_9160/g.18541  ORF Transcript_9160/g.18541 Transcript_9160/m.18541 type:complete len:214 (-) Transcript_9160:3567-4208(-)